MLNAQGAGFALLCIGGMLADSERLWIPLLIIIAGAYLILHGEGR